MHDAGKISAGLVVFLALVTLPVWYHAALGAETGPPELPATTKGENCVAEGRYMRALHMDLLNVWRDQAVREGDVDYVGLGGKVYDKSIEATCLGCHGDREHFCDQCHEYVGAEPYCWGCHGEASEIH
jgi:hypothetical protein